MKEARPDQIWTIPNVLTMIRLALIPLYWMLMVKGQQSLRLNLQRWTDGMLRQMLQHFLTDSALIQSITI